MAEYTSFGFMRPGEDETPKAGAPLRNEEEPPFGQKAMQFFPKLIDKIRQNRLDKLYKQNLYCLHTESQDGLQKILLVDCSYLLLMNDMTK